MKVCPNCQATHEDSMQYCLQCGTALVEAAPQPEQAAPQPEPQVQQAAEQAQYQQPQYQQPQYQQQPQFDPQYGAPAAYPPPYQVQDPFDHTEEFSAEDISDNKIYAMLPYLLSFFGVIISVLAAKESEYVKFHIKQALKLNICAIILSVFSAVLFWTFIVPAAAGVCLLIIEVLTVIAFIQVCKGKAKEPAIIKKIKFFN